MHVDKDKRHNGDIVHAEDEIENQADGSSLCGSVGNLEAVDTHLRVDGSLGHQHECYCAALS